MQETDGSEIFGDPDRAFGEKEWDDVIMEKRRTEIWKECQMKITIPGDEEGFWRFVKEVMPQIQDVPSYDVKDVDEVWIAVRSSIPES